MELTIKRSCLRSAPISIGRCRGRFWRRYRFVLSARVHTLSFFDLVAPEAATIERLVVSASSSARLAVFAGDAPPLSRSACAASAAQERLCELQVLPGEGRRGELMFNDIVPTFGADIN